MIEIVKQAAVEAVNAADPSGLEYGTVISADPLKVRLDTKEILDEGFFILTNNVRKYQTKIKIDKGELKKSLVGTDNEHTHEFPDEFTITVNNELKADDKVILIKQQGGQKYVILDKIGGSDGTDTGSG